MDRITVLWFSSDSRLSGLIRWVTRSEFSHVAVMVRGTLYEALGSGIVARRDVDALTRAGEAAAFVDIPVGAADAGQAVAWLEAHVANGYSLLGFLAAGIGALTRWRLVIALDGEYICSGLAAEALARAGVSIEGEARLQTPGSLADQLMPRYGGDQDHRYIVDAA